MSLKDNINNLINEKDKIKQYWLSNQIVLDVLQKYDIDTTFFLENFADSVVGFYFEAIKDSSKIGDCPAIEKLIDFLKDKNIESNELFLICSGFKNALIKVLYELNLQSYENNVELNKIFEQNFAGVLNKYSKTIKEVEVKLEKTIKIIDKYIIMSQTDKKGIIVDVSDAFCKISEYEKDELIGQPHNIIRHPETPDVVFEDMWETIKSGRTWQGEIKNKKKNGGFYWVYATIEPLYENGEISGYYAIRQDITSKKEVERQQDVLVEQSKSAAMGEMISMIAHQWRQPLQAVSILVQKLSLTKMIEGEITDDVLDQVVEDVSQQLEYMSKTIDDFRDFFRPDKAKEMIMVSRLVDKARDFLAYMLKVDMIEFKIFTKEDAQISVHINELVQVLINIIKNARDAMLERKTQNRKLHITHYKTAKYAIIEIEDNAGGIPDSVIGRIFEPYYSTKSNKNGTGLGLYMSKTIVEQHCNGILSVKNNDENNGAIFKISLPL